MKNYENFMHKLTKTKLSCGKSLTELTTYQGVPLWLFANFRFYSFMTRLLEESDTSARSTLMWMTYKAVEPFLSFSKMIFAGFALKFYGKQKANDRTGERGIPKILFTSENLEWRVIRDYESNGLKKTDAFFDSIISKSAHKYKYVGVYPIGLSTRGLRIFVDKLRNWNITHKPFELHWSFDALRRESAASRYFRQLWKELNKDANFKKLCTYDGRNLYAEIGAELRFYFLVVFPRFVENINVAKQMVRREKPDLILIEEEYGEFERALAVAGKLENTRTLAIQHGIFTLTDFSYIFEKEDRERMILPDLTALYGQYYYDLLTKDSIYAPEQIVITGQPRYDILYHVDRIYSKKKFLEEHKINPLYKILLWTTQSHGLSNEENTENFETVFETMQEIKNVTLIIKQHPGEGERHTEMIKKYLSNYTVDVILTEKNSDTYEQIYICDLLMTKTSTTAMEAVALNKPVIILNLGEQADTIDYVQQGVALGVYKEEDLKTAIRKLLASDAELARNREQYVRKYLYKIDGKAAERVVNIIGKIINKEK